MKNKKTKVTSLILCITILIISGCADKKDPAISQIETFIAEQKVNKTLDGWKTALSIPPELKFSKDKTYTWKLETTEGTMLVDFLPNEAPVHVSSTIYLTTLGFYDDITFHRVIQGFMAQGGDPLGNGRGGPGYKYDGEYSGPSKHDKAGTLSMANAGQGTDGSQFFLTFKATPHLNGRHTVFGYVSSGMETLQKIEQLGSRTGKPSKEIKITKASIIVK